MNKKEWTIEQILELTENLYKHHEDYGQGRTQDFYTVCLNCKYAAEIIHDLLHQGKVNDAKIFEEQEYRANKAESENRMLKECIVRMTLGRYGVLND